MSLAFPNNPTLNQTYQSGSSSTYQWNGTFWQTLLPPTQVTLFATSASSAVTANTASFSTTASFATSASRAISASFATTASFAQSRPLPQYISARKSAVQTGSALNTDVTFQSTNASNGLSLTGSTTVGLTGGKVYLVNASFGSDTWGNSTTGFMNIYLVDSANNPIALNYAVMVPVTNTSAASTNNSMTLICAPTASVAVKFRCVSTNTTATLREDMCHFTITEII